MINQIKIGKLYSIPYSDVALYGIDDAEFNPFRYQQTLRKNTPFIILEAIETLATTYNGQTICRFKILTTTGLIRWINIAKCDLEYLELRTVGNNDTTKS